MRLVALLNKVYINSKNQLNGLGVSSDWRVITVSFNIQRLERLTTFSIQFLNNKKNTNFFIIPFQPILLLRRAL